MMIKKKKIFLVVVVVFFVIVGSYTTWNYADPKNSCASCHEINLSVASAGHSAHRNTRCVECHGTALSNGFHSIKEKIGMLFTHITQNKKNEDIGLSEEQVLSLVDRCKNCHQTEYADWRSSGHSATYSQIFLNEKHNKMETPYWDCFRCHGMFYNGNINDLLNVVDNKGPWSFKDSSMANRSTIPCLACHEIHSENITRKSAVGLKNPKLLFYEKEKRNVDYGLYVRADKMFLRADNLSCPKMFDGNKEVITSKDHSQALCIQCHSPNYKHEAGSSDDRTPTGVHEGLSCSACHKPHSNNSQNSCDNCHPANSNCGLEVKKMNTTYADPKSPNNIHHVKCKDCHTGNKFIRSHKQIVVLK